METKINIAKILKNKPEGTKLWTDMFGSVTLYVVTDACDAFQVKHHNKEPWFDEDGKLYEEGVLCIYPSKSMRDWSKFAWEKGDVLIRTNSEYCIGIFDEWTSDDYSTFSAKYINLGLSDNFSCSYTCKTEEWEKTENSKNYISEIERVMNGKLNLQTLEIQTQPEFKDGDIVCISGMGYLAYGIVKIIDNSSKKLEYYVLNDMSTLKFEDWLSFEDKQIQPITETQRIILFDALANEGKAWDSDKKAIVDLKPKVELKPFDKVLCRNSKDDTWEADFFARLTRKEIDYTQSGKYLCVGDLWMYCIPYNEETAHLLGTADDWEGGEQ